MGDGGNSASLVAAGFGTQAISSIGNSYSQYKALESQGAYQKQVYDFNTKVADLQSSDALRRGDVAISQERKGIRQAVGSERVALAAQGIDTESGSAKDIQDTTQLIGAQNEITIKANAWREAWGYKSQAVASAAAGQFANLSNSNMANNTILTGGINAIGSLLNSGYYGSGGGIRDPRPGANIAPGSR